MAPISPNPNPNPNLFVPRHYQVEGADFLANSKKAILADEMGVGKTGTSLLAWKQLYLKGPALLIAGINSQSVWLIQSQRWGVQIPYIISGQKTQREKEWRDATDPFAFSACTIEALRNDLKSGIAPKKWGTVIVDEAHRVGNRKTLSFKAIKSLETQNLFLLTGSPMRRGFQDLWSLLHLCNKRQFSSYWRFLQTFGYMQQNEYGAWEILGLKDKEALSRIIAPYYLRREKRDVAPELPPKQRILDHHLKPTPMQLYMYLKLEEEMMAELSTGEILLTPTILSKLTRLRQVLVSPKILDPDHPEYGASLEHLGDLLADTEDHHFVIFTPFASAIPITQEFLQDKCKIPSEQIQALQGGLSAETVNERISQFRQQQGIMICTIQYAESFDLTPATWAYFLGFSWSATENLQAEDRIHRLTTISPVTYYYPQHQNCIDEDLIMPTLDEKSTEILKVFDTSDRLRKFFQDHMPDTSSRGTHR